MNYYFSVLSNYAQFNGRARRSKYWFFALFNGIVSVILIIVESAVGMPDAINGIYRLAVLIPSIAVTVRRMHDVGKSGWYCLIPIDKFVLACTEGDEGANKYGPDPKAEEVAA